MKTNTRARSVVAELVTLALTLGLAASMTTVAHAQGVQCATYPGDKTVVLGVSGQTIIPTYAHDYIDVSTLATSNDVCAAIALGFYYLNGGDTTDNTKCFTPLYNGKGVIDARAVPSSSGTFSCQTSPFPNTTAKGVTVLLPAGTIQTTAPWILSPNTHLIGQGPGIVGALDGAGGTTLQAKMNSFTGSELISMGDAPSQGSTICGGGNKANCNGISIEHLRLDGNFVNAIGISNNWSQELNYVNDVQMTNMVGTGLQIVGELTNPASPPGKADNSGPYTNIYYSGSGSCVSISGTYGTRGIHGLSCIGTGSPSVAAILLDGSNNTIQDVTITGYTGDGIAIGSQTGFAQDNLLFNITGTGSVSKLVHIYKNANGTPTDLTLMSISGGAVTLQDDVAQPALPISSPVGLYVLGEPLGGTAGYSRFTTSSSVPAWYVGPGFTSTSGNVCQTPGSLYSATASSTAATLWGCIGTDWFPLSSN